eukprot:375164-Prymnesium_polylepis.1
MLLDALLLAEPHMPLHLPGGRSLLLSEAGTDADPRLDGFVQLSDAIVPMVAAAAAAAPPGSEAAAALGDAAALLERIHRRQLYRYVGSVVVRADEMQP